DSAGMKQLAVAGDYVCAPKNHAWLMGLFQEPEKESSVYSIFFFSLSLSFFCTLYKPNIYENVNYKIIFFRKKVAGEEHNTEGNDTETIVLTSKRNECD
ncbi:hypothetical protein ACJX0J_008422, partial [Zea mays]